MKAEVKISSWQAMAYIIILILPTAILFVPAITASFAGPDAWVSLLAALSFGLLAALAASTLAIRFPDETVIEYAPKLLGKYLGKFVSFIYAFYFYYVAYFVLRQFSELMSSTYMIGTPLWIHVTVLMLIACYALHLGLEALSRTNAVVTAFFLFSITIIILLTVPTIDSENFQPVLDTPPGRIIMGALSPGSWLSECAVILMLVPFLANKKRAIPATIFAVIIVFIAMFFVTVATIGLFGSEVASRMVYPAFSLASNTRMEFVLILERIDVLFMTIWVGGMAFKLITFYYAGTIAFAQLFGIPSYRTLILPGAILLITLSLNSWGNITELFEFSGQVFPASIIFVNFVLTLILLLFSFFQSLRLGGN